MDKETVYRHPSYGLIQFSHRQGSPRLFASSLDRHYNYVTVSIKTATLRRSDTGDRYDGPMHGDIVEVDLSAAQFAELLTTANMGCGTPCTIRRREGEQVPSPPDIDSQAENIRTEFEARAKEFAREILADSQAIKKMLKEKASLNKGDREQISRFLGRVAQELEQNMPFLVEMYQEATEKVVTSAKAEVEAFYVGAVRQAGLAAIAAGQVNVDPPQLPATTTSSEPKE
jgi:hypothetical protein